MCVCVCVQYEGATTLSISTLTMTTFTMSSITTLSIMTFSIITPNAYAERHYAECLLCWESKLGPLCWMLLYWMFWHLFESQFNLTVLCLIDICKWKILGQLLKMFLQAWILMEWNSQKFKLDLNYGRKNIVGSIS